MIDADDDILLKKDKSVEQASGADECDAQSVVVMSANISSQQSFHDLEEKIVASVETKLEELKKIMGKVYVLQKRSSQANQVRFFAL